jgi:hypothetical protein
MKHFSALNTLLCVLFLGTGSVPAADFQNLPGGLLIDPNSYDLGNTVTNWPETSPKPHGTRLELQFKATANSREAVLSLNQRAVSGRCALRINGKEVAELRRNDAPATFLYRLPPGTLTNGLNLLTIAPVNTRNDLMVGPIRLFDQTLRDLLQLRQVLVTLTDRRTGKPVPGRVTVTDLKDRRAELYYVDRARTASREGVVYTLGGETAFELPPGKYAIYAARGMEWSRDRQQIIVDPNNGARVELHIEREVDTTGFIAADTHIHTVTFSGHGDATIDERMLTLAGEGVELAISTDHNHNTDYRPYQEKMCVTDYFTPVTGNEVTTALGHMNAFPLKAGDPVPSHKLNDWVKLTDNIRSKGARVIILNHPRWPSIPRSPMTHFGLNRASGDFAGLTNQARFPFDGMELANSGAPQPDPLYLFRDWFALLNYGERITAIGSSDSHTVDEPVGQGRCFVPSATDDPSRVDVDAACKHFLAGETSVALGIFSDILVDGRFRMGQIDSLREKALKVRLRVASPSWVVPRRAMLFLNGQVIAEKEVPRRGGRPTDTWIDFAVDRPHHDGYLVAVVLGDGAFNPGWKTKAKYTLAATNPVYLDTDGDGRYSSPRETARRALSAAGSEPGNQWAAVAKADEVIAVQMASLMRARTPASGLPAFDQLLAQSASKRPLLQEFVKEATTPIEVAPAELH